MEIYTQREYAVSHKNDFGRGWGQGPQHSQIIPTLYTSVSGINVYAPATPNQARDYFYQAIFDDSPSIFLEHRWLHGLKEKLADNPSKQKILGKGRIAKFGTDYTLVSYSYGVLECMKIANFLSNFDLNVEVIDLQSLSPLDMDLVLASVKKTKNMIFFEIGQSKWSVGSQVISELQQLNEIYLGNKPLIIGCDSTNSPSSPLLAKTYYPNFADIGKAICYQLNKTSLIEKIENELNSNYKVDLPDLNFNGPF